MILVPFVENAFKYGLNPTAPSFIEIALRCERSAFEFRIRNSIHDRSEEKGNGERGIGLHNVQRQLEILYPRKHELLINREEGVFDVKLKIFSLD
jgi:sensor histidine kinase YesM